MTQFGLVYWCCLEINVADCSSSSSGFRGASATPAIWAYLLVKTRYYRQTIHIQVIKIIEGGRCQWRIGRPEFQDRRPAYPWWCLAINLWHLMVYLRQSGRTSLTPGSALQVAQTGGGLADRRWLCVRRVCPTLRRVTTTSSRRMEQQEDLHGSVTDFTSRSLLPCVWYQSSCHFARMRRRRAVLQCKLRTPCIRKPWVVACLAPATAASIPLIPTWPGIQCYFKIPFREGGRLYTAPTQVDQRGRGL
jgi:hypothetical protein